MLLAGMFIQLQPYQTVNTPSGRKNILLTKVDV